MFTQTKAWVKIASDDCPHKALRRCALRKNTRTSGLEVLKGPVGTAEIGFPSDPCSFPFLEPLQGWERFFG